MKLLDYIAPERVAPALDVADKEGALAALAALLAGGDGEEAERIREVLAARERLASTGVGHEVAIPHGKLGDLDAPRVALARCPKGVDFDSIDGSPVRLLFAMVAPKSANAAHLKILARISRITHAPEARERLLTAGGRDELLAVLAEQDALQDR